MNYRRDFEQQSPVDGAPTMAAPAAGQQPRAWPQQAPAGGPGAYPPSGQPPGMYYDQPPPYGQQVMAPSPAQLPV